MKSTCPILIVDDDHSVLASLRLMLKQAGWSTDTVDTPELALERVKASEYALIVQDMNFSRTTTGEEGLELLKRMRALAPTTPVILLTAWGSIDLAVSGMKLGASDFATKPWDNHDLLRRIEIALALHAPEASPEGLSRDELDEKYEFSQVIGRHPALVQLLNTVARIAPTDAPVLILGESGTGKELIADALHLNSGRRDGPLVKTNLGGIPASLFESEMFGHVKGAFTDAQRDRVGRFALADGGTLFMDEVGDIDRSCQVKLLRVLQDRHFEPVGSSKPRTADVRIVSATNRDLDAMAAADEFREDLLYRLNLITLRLPPLRERRSDIRLIALHHLSHTAQMYGRAQLEISEEGLKWLEQQDWPGNVRELRQAIERAVLMSGKTVLTAADFSVKSTRKEPEPAALSELTLDEMEQLMIRRSLEESEGNVSRAAESLGLSRPALYRRMEKYGIT